MTDRHEDVELLLPWRITDTLDGKERAAVDRHVANCVACRSQLRELEEISLALRTGPALGDGEVPEFVIERGRPVALRGSERRGSDRRMLRLLLASQVAALLLITGFLILGRTGPATAPAEREPAFRTLATEPSTGATARAQVRVLLAEDLTEQALRTLLAEIGGQMIDGPSLSGLYVIELDLEQGAGSLSQRIDRLRAHAGVRFAEPVASTP